MTSVKHVEEIGGFYRIKDCSILLHAILCGHSLTGDISLYQQGSDPKLQTVQEI